jgi:hypothetical protein
LSFSACRVADRSSKRSIQKLRPLICLHKMKVVAARPRIEAEVRTTDGVPIEAM